MRVQAQASAIRSAGAKQSGQSSRAEWNRPAAEKRKDGWHPHAECDGGCVPTTLALGWVRILQREGVLQQARYLSSNSGGSWFNSPFSYQERYAPETFLGAYMEPKDLTPAAAEGQTTTEGCYAKAVADSSFMRDFLSNMVSDWFSLDFLRDRDRNKVRAWSEAVGTGFLDPFAVGAFNAAYCLAGREEHTQTQTLAPVVYTA